MKKAERLAAAKQIRETEHIGDRFETKLACGMIVRCDNTIGARDNMAKKFERGPRLPPNSANLLKRRLLK